MRHNMFHGLNQPAFVPRWVRGKWQYRKKESRIEESEHFHDGTLARIPDE